MWMPTFKRTVPGFVLVSLYVSCPALAGAAEPAPEPEKVRLETTLITGLSLSWLESRYTRTDYESEEDAERVSTTTEDAQGVSSLIEIAALTNVGPDWLWLGALGRFGMVWRNEPLYGESGFQMLGQVGPQVVLSQTPLAGYYFSGAASVAVSEGVGWGGSVGGGYRLKPSHGGLKLGLDVSYLHFKDREAGDFGSYRYLRNDLNVSLAVGVSL